MSGRLRRVQSFVSLELRPGSAGVEVWKSLGQAIAARATPFGDRAGARSEYDLGTVK
jgi:hypothetical protein